MPSRDHLISNLTFPRAGQDSMVGCAVISGGRISCLEFCDERLNFFQLYLRSVFLCLFNLYDTAE